MLRKIHLFIGIPAALLVCFMAITGAILSIFPAIDHFQTRQTVNELSVGDLAAVVAAREPAVDRIVKKADGVIIAYFNSGGGKRADIIDPVTGADMGSYEPSAFVGIMTELHRSMFMGRPGKLIAGFSALCMAVLCISGIFLVVARFGGWSKLFSPSQGSLRQRLHVDGSRVAVSGLMITALSGIYMTCVSFGLIADGASSLVAFPQSVNGGQPAPISSLMALRTMHLADLRELAFPASGDPSDVFTVSTSSGQGFVDQATGQMLSFRQNGWAQAAYETIYMLHTGQGMWWLGLVLGLCAVAVPLLAITGMTMWWARRSAMPHIAHNSGHNTADTIILVGSQGNSTWAFAAALHEALTAAGQKVHTKPMNSLRSDYRNAQQLFILTSTYGDGGAPASADRFLQKLEDIKRIPRLHVAIVGFGDRGFGQYCRFAADVEAAMEAKGWPILERLFAVDRQSSTSFFKWAKVIGKRIGLELNLSLDPPTSSRSTDVLTLIGRRDYGLEVQAPISIFQFTTSGKPLRYEAGDLLGIVPPGTSTPRYYSLASSTADGVVEICVRKQQGGLCSELLHSLAVGAEVHAFVQENPNFRPQGGKTPIIMIASGTGIAPLMGFVRQNAGCRDMYLYWGGRHPKSDFLYENSLQNALKGQRLQRLTTAFSRIPENAYVQDRILGDAETIRALVKQGAQILVCGGRDMAAGVIRAVDEVISPLGLDVSGLKQSQRYLEDVY